MRRALRIAGFVLGALGVLLLTLWAVGAIFFDLPIASLRKPLAIIYGLGAVGILFLYRKRGRALAFVALGFLLVLAWWLTLQPRQDRDWKPSVAQLAHATIAGERVTIHNVRNFDYRTETDFAEQRETRDYDLRKMRGVDLFITYWGSAAMAHPILSFDFGEDGRVCFSIETRPERGESYSAVRGFYRQFEETYIAADERDVIRLRSNYREGEDVYLYRLTLSPAAARSAFLEYIRSLNALHAQPRWYNALTSNCTTAIRRQRAAEERLPWDWRMIANGYGDEMLYERNAIETFGLPFAELKRRAHINPRAHAANDAADFSERIRTHFTAGARTN